MSSSTTKTTKTVSVVKKESFFDDAFFSDNWGDFDLAIQGILDKFENKGRKVDSASRNECRDLYRTIRTSKIDEDIYASQALQVTEKDGRFNCVMDVKDFNPNQLQVKVVEDRVVVEGKYEKKSEDGSSMSSKSFYKEFSLPSTANLDLVSTALSKDGVLTVRAPKMEGNEVVAANPAGAVTQSSSSVQESSSVQKSSDGNSESSSSSMVKKSSTSVQQSSVKESSSSTTTSSIKKQSFSQSSTSSFSSSFSSNTAATTNAIGSIDKDFDKEFGDMTKAMNDRLVFTHESVNLKLPEN